MSKISIGFGVALIALGVGFYLDSSQPTALIPAGFGLLIGLFGALEALESPRRMLQHIGGTFGAIGAVAGLSMGISAWWKLEAGVSMPAPTIAKLSMGALCILSLALRKPPWSGWLQFSKFMAWVTAPLRWFVTFLLLSMIYWLMLPFWALFMNGKDPLRKKLDANADSYFEPYKDREPTLESLSHAS